MTKTPSKTELELAVQLHDLKVSGTGTEEDPKRVVCKRCRVELDPLSGAVVLPGDGACEQ